MNTTKTLTCAALAVLPFFLLSPAFQGSEIPGDPSVSLDPPHQEPDLQPILEVEDGTAKRTMAAVIEDFHGTQHKVHGGGHPEYGDFQTRDRFERHMANLCRFGLSKEEFVDRSLLWGRDEPRFVPPYWAGQNPMGKVLTQDQQAAIEREIEAFNRLIADAAGAAYTFLEHYTEVYARGHTQRYPASEKIETKAYNGHTEYRAYTHVLAGDWKYVVDFRSAEYPDLDMAIQSIGDLKAERRRTLRARIAAL